MRVGGLDARRAMPTTTYLFHASRITFHVSRFTLHSLVARTGRMKSETQ